ncbi:hypothetical protein EDB83DRAFT_439810 [Lactarius deliciosus]|nr:hypothetical protein EDB83DRAFT_439810 [Lactarius deliciosus]
MNVRRILGRCVVLLQWWQNVSHPANTADDEDAAVRFLRRAFVKTGADIACARGPSSSSPSSSLSSLSPTSASSASSLRRLFLLIEPAAAATLSDNSTTTRPLPLAQSRGGTVIVARVLKQHAHDVLVFLVVAPEGCTPPHEPASSGRLRGFQD